MSRVNENINPVSSEHFLANTFLSKLALLGELVKIKITVLVSLTTALGYILGANKISLDLFYSVFGIFILACGSAALNQYQERDTDALMDRTKERPIPSGRINGSGVLMISLSLLFLGSVVLILGANVLTLAIGLFTFFWYNGVYTPLKKKIALAIIPGSLVGALPPLAGWVSAGGNILDIKILYVAFYFFVWQIPHFWLLLLIYGKDFSKGGFPVLSNKISEKGIAGITFIMLLFTVLVALFIPLLNILSFNITYISLCVISVLMIYTSFNFLISDLSKKEIFKAFIGINIYTLFFITFLSADKFFRLFI